MNSIYLDHNATTPLDPRVAEEMAECQRRYFANPSSQHRDGRAARTVLEEARDGIAELLGGRVTTSAPDRLIFTSGGTEANNLALLGTVGDRPARVICSALEHPSVTMTAREIEARGGLLCWLDVTAEGTISLPHLRRQLDEQQLDHGPVQSVALMLANNETGAIQPVAEASRLCAEGGVPLHCDAVQGVGKIPVDFTALGAATLSVAAHKFRGPRGIGGLLVRDGHRLVAQLRGGQQQLGLRPGTEPVALAVGMHAALRLCHSEAAARAERVSELRDRLENQLRAEFSDLVIHAQRGARLPNTSGFAIPGVDRQALIMALDVDGVACSTGSACASGSSEPSSALRAMGVSEAVLEASIRVSLGPATTAAEVDQAASRIIRLGNDLRRRFSHRKSPRTSRH